jgi:hypothetical protein
MARSAWTKEGLSSGDASGPSSAMAAMASAHSRGEGECERSVGSGESERKSSGSHSGGGRDVGTRGMEVESCCPA